MGIVRRPINWNPVRVKIANITRVGPTIDPVFNVPVNTKERLITYTYDAQVNLMMKSQDRKFRTASGDRPDTRGHLVFRTIDLAPITALPKPEKGWKIVALYAGEVDELEVDYLIEEIRHESPLRGRPLLIYASFQMDRNRSRSG